MGVYAATKWGIEGFFEGTIPEIAPFGIEVTLVEPGASRTNFASSSADAGKVLDVYEKTPAGDFRRRAAAAGLAMFPGDPRKVASAIIASADQHPAPKRLTLGSDAYALVHKALIVIGDLPYSTEFHQLSTELIVRESVAAPRIGKRS